MEAERNPKTPVRRSRGGKYTQKKQKPEKKQSRKYLVHRRKRDLVFFLLPAAAAVVVALLVVLLLDQGTSYVFETSGKQYYAGNTGLVPAGSELKIQEDGTALLCRDGEENTTGLPIYLDGVREVVIPQDAIYYDPRGKETKRVLHFSHVSCTSGGAVTVTRESKQAHKGQGFLFDGKDFFLFLEPMTVSFNGYGIDVPPLSYVEAVYGGYIMIYNYDTGEFFMEEPKTPVTAQAAGEDYVLSLIGDSLTRRDGSKVLLTSRPDMIDPIF